MISVPHTSGISQSAAEFHLGQPWSDSLEVSFRPATVHLAWPPEALRVEAELVDEDVFSQADADNQKLWELGDVFEVFLMLEGRREYVELHITPNGKRMHLRLPGVGGKASPEADPVSFEDMLVSPPGFTAHAELMEGGWRVRMEIPATALQLKAFHSGQQLRISFCRYDATHEGQTVLSTTANHPVVSFHRPDEWTAIQLGPVQK